MPKRAENIRDRQINECSKTKAKTMKGLFRFIDVLQDELFF